MKNIKSGVKMYSGFDWRINIRDVNPTEPTRKIIDTTNYTYGKRFNGRF
ncbi:MAG: hypothetical protein ACP5HC_07065 [Caldisericum sp.]